MDGEFVYKRILSGKYNSHYGLIKSKYILFQIIHSLHLPTKLQGISVQCLPEIPSLTFSYMKFFNHIHDKLGSVVTFRIVHVIHVLANCSSLS